MKLTKTSTLWYAHDPMCSYCYAFSPVFAQLEETLSFSGTQVKYLLGGLAPDSNQAMDSTTIAHVKAAWLTISEEYGTEFNFDYWDKNTPRRSTYNACRAVLVAKEHNLEKEMIHGIQQAYYLQAKNPSNINILADIAESIGIDVSDFTGKLLSPEINQQLRYNIEQARVFSMYTFPSLVLVCEKGASKITIDYKNADNMASMIENILLTDSD